MSAGIRTATTQAVRSVREESFTRDVRELPIRQALNLRQLLQIIHCNLSDDSTRPVKSGTKRTALVQSNPNKRRKMEGRVEANAAGELPVYIHRFEIGYTTNWSVGEAGVVKDRSYANNGRATFLGWIQEEKQLVDAFTNREIKSPLTFELDDVTLENYLGVAQLRVGFRPELIGKEKYNESYLLTLPNCNCLNHLQSETPQNLLTTCSLLLHTGHISMSVSASLLYIPGINAPELPIQFHVDVHISLKIPAIFSPLSLHAPSMHSIEEQRGLLLSYVFYYHSTNPCRVEKREHRRDLGELRQFYALLEPASPVSTLTIYEALQPRGLCVSLLPFQRHTLRWLLERGGKTLDSCGRVVPHSKDLDTLPLFWRRVPSCIDDAVEASTGQSCWYYNRLTGSFSEEMPPPDNVLGAMLCEEMGLGKTLECIALMLLDPATDRNPTETRRDATTELNISQVKTNLIVTPSTLSQQWLDELARHAPGLRVLAYLGYRKTKLPTVCKRDNEGEAVGQSDEHSIWTSYIHDFDVIVTTYTILSQELYVAKTPVIRPKRQAASYSHVVKPRSPLVRVEWARVFMDEVQLAGGGKTAEMVSLIPRHVSIAVSGTPAKSNISDLFHVLKFLRVEPAIGSHRTWNSLLKPEFSDLFSELFKRYAVRTSKLRVKDELTIPSQRRFVIGIELGKAERHIYDLTLQEALDELGVDHRGVAASEGWEIDITLLRSWLRRLRQVCTHPQVGSFKIHNAAAKSINAKTIQTVEEVLEGYQEQNWNSLITDSKNRMQIRTRRAQLIQLTEDVNRYHRARDLLSSLQPEVEQLLTDVKVAITAHEERRKEIIEKAAAQRLEGEQPIVDQDLQVTAKGKGRATDVDFTAETNPNYDDLPKTPLGDAHRVRQRNLQSRLREVHVLQHRVMFFLGDIYHMLGLTLEEEALYAAAETVRKTLLKSTEQSALSAMEKIQLRDGTRLREDLKLILCGQGGIRSALLVEEANDILELLNEQGELLWRWRSRIMTLLKRSFTSDEDKADGEEYARALDTQGEAEAYLEAYTALIADRKEVLIAERTVLAAHDDRETKARETLAARKANGLMDSDDLDEIEGLDNKILKRELAEERRGLKEDRSQRALKGIMFQLNEIGNRAGDRLEENHIARLEANHLRTIIAEQGLVMEKFELELASFRKVFNERIQYFRQLQELSDSVVQPEYTGELQDVIKTLKTEEDLLTLQVNAKRARQRHFNNIAQDRASGELERNCVLCQNEFQHGLVTPCAHIFCEVCLKAWIKNRGRKTSLDCPMCRSHVEVETLKRIAFDDRDGSYQEKHKSKTLPKQLHHVRFNTLPQQTLDEIETFQVIGSYGSKIKHLVRHLLYLQSQEPGTKSVVFSAWSDSLTIIQSALKDNGIGSIRVDQKGKQDAAQKFKTEPQLLVFLLHGERENAGLNLTCAKRVLLIEPTVNHAFEIQAISRVDRMGQTSTTEVFCYYIQDSVEENILRMRCRGGLSLYTEEHAEEAIDISELAMGSRQVPVDSPSKKEKQKGDFIAQTDDLIHVLFPHLDVEQVDFTDPENIPSGNESEIGMNSIDKPSTNGDGQVNAIAGPSRLH